MSIPPPDSAFLETIIAYMTISVGSNVLVEHVQKESPNPRLSITNQKTMKAFLRSIEAFVASFYWTWGAYFAIGTLTGVKLLSGIGPFNLSILDPVRMSIYLFPLFLRYVTIKIIQHIGVIRRERIEQAAANRIQFRDHPVSDFQYYELINRLDDHFHKAIVITNLALLSIGVGVSILAELPLHTITLLGLIALQINPDLPFTLFRSEPPPNPSPPSNFSIPLDPSEKRKKSMNG